MYINMAFSKKKALEALGELIVNYSNDEIWNEIIQRMNNLPINFSPYMIYGEDFDSFNTISILDIDRDVSLRFLDKEELLEFLIDKNFLIYLDLYKNYCDEKESDSNIFIEDFNFFIKELPNQN